MHKLRTLDVWDTLLRRKCHPDAVKLATAQHVFLRFRKSLTEDMKDHWRLFDKRIDVERALAQKSEASGKDDEYELSEVLTDWLKTILSSPLPENLNEVVQDIAEREFAFEVANSFADEGIEDFLAAYPAEKSIFLSDFYMSSQMVEHLIAAKELSHLASSGIVSCDVGKNKRSGRLFPHVQDIFNVSPNEHIHIGDNSWADVDAPRRLGMKAIHYLPDTAHKERLIREGWFASRGDLFDHLTRQTAKATQTYLETTDRDQASAFRLGTQAAPLFLGFCLFVAEQTILNNDEKLFFFTREGEFFIRIFHALFPDKTLAGLDLPPDDILAVSRQSTFAASLDRISIEEFNRIWNLNWQQKLSTLFQLLDLKLEDFSGHLERLGLSADELINRPQDDPRIAALFETPDFLSAASASAGDKRAVLERYLAQHGIRDGSSAGVVDIGWRGTIQDNLAYVAPNCKLHGYYLALRQFLNSQPTNTTKCAFGPDERLEDVAAFFETFEPLELLCNSPNGSTVGYADKDGTVFPVRDANETENVIFERFTRYFQDGVLFAAMQWREQLANHAVMSHEMRDMALHVWATLSRVPPSQLIDAYYGAPQHDVFGFGGFFDRAQAPSLTTLMLATVSRKHRKETIQYIRRTQWMAGIKGLQTNPVHKAALMTVFWLAQRYKRWGLLRKRKISATKAE